MSARDAWHPLEQGRRQLESISDTALGICALGSLMQCADVTKVDDSCLSGLGILLEKVGVAILTSTHDCGELIGKQPE